LALGDLSAEREGIMSKPEVDRLFIEAIEAVNRLAVAMVGDESTVSVESVDDVSRAYNRLERAKAREAGQVFAKGRRSLTSQSEKMPNFSLDRIAAAL
jgi:hypothetical protein